MRCLASFFAPTSVRCSCFFYPVVQRFVSGLCVSLTKEYQRGSDQVLSLMSFDPVLVFYGSKDEIVDALLDTFLLLVRHRLLEEDSSAVNLRQYNEVSGFFRQKWRNQSKDVPVVDDILNLWLSTHIGNGVLNCSMYCS